MKPIATILLFIICSAAILQAQPCTTTNGTNCLCPESGSLHCQLLPDLAISRDILLEPDLNPEKKGELRLSVATPNLGYGPLEIHATFYFVCGTDTIYQPGGMTNCPDGSYPKQLIQQTVYSKSNEEITSTWRWAGSMTYHPTHGHMHVDNWCNYSLRIPIEGETNPLNWTVIAQGSKLGFCLMDYGSCDYYNGYCKNENNETLNSSNMPNYGMGGGEYACGLNQGISAGWTDIYHHYLEGMNVPIGADVCDGEYQLVIEVDPSNNFLEINEANNILVMPFTLSQQNMKPNNLISASGNITMCKGDSYQLSATTGNAFLWNTGDTVATISVTQGGDYYATVFTDCEAIVSDTLHINLLDADINNVQNDTLCQTGIATLSTTADGNISWYDAPTNGNLVGTGNTFVSPEISSTTTYYVEQSKEFLGETQFNEPHNNTFGNGGTNSTQFNGAMYFDVHQDMILKSVKVYLPANGTSGNRTIQVIDSSGTVIQEKTTWVTSGESRLELNFEVPKGVHYTLQSTQHPGLWRTSTDVVFPYTIQDVVSITGSNYDDPAQDAYYYYYYYDWEVKQPDYICQSTTRTPVTAVVMNCVGIEQIDFASSINISPNPNNGNCDLQMNMLNNNPTHITLHDITGKIVWQKNIQQIGIYNTPIDLQEMASGIYILKIENSQQQYFQKIIRY